MLHVESRRITSAALAVAVALGVVIRMFQVLSADFPLNDGGLFYVMVQEVQRADYRLPSTTAYNDSEIPFAYPPLGLYAAAAVQDLTGLPLPDIFRFLPSAVAGLTLLAFLSFARLFLPADWSLLAAVFAFAAMPRSFIWMIMGGGVTRAWGFLFAIVTLHQVYRMYTERHWRYVVTATLCSGLTVLSHLGTAPFLAFSIALFWLYYGRHAFGFFSSGIVALGTLVVSAPWWATVVAEHGFGTFMAAMSTGGSIVTDQEARRGVVALLLRFGIGNATGGTTGEAIFPVLGVLALLGTLVAFRMGKTLMPVWWLVILVLDTRAGTTYATIPVSMLAGLGITHAVVPLATLPFGERGATPAHPRWFLALVLGYTVLYVVGSTSVKHPSLQSEIRFLLSLQPEERAAMRWVAAETPPSSRFLVVPDSQWSTWQTDKTSEWFPALADRVSVSTVQGTEWLPGGVFKQRQTEFKQLRECGTAIVTCLESWARRVGRSFTHVYVPQPMVSADERYLLCCQLLIESLRDHPNYTLLYDGPGAVVFERRLRP